MNLFKKAKSATLTRYQAERAALQPDIDALPRVPELEAACRAAFDAEAAVRVDPMAPAGAAQAASAATNACADELRAVRDHGEEARRRARELDAMIEAAANVERLKARLKEAHTTGPELERRELAIDAAIDGLQAKINAAEAEIESHVTRTAEAEFEATMAGKPAPQDGSTQLATLQASARGLHAQMGVARRQRSKVRAEKADLVESTREDAAALLVARMHAAKVELLDALPGLTPLREYLAAATAARRPREALDRLLVDELAVRRRADELAAEGAPWHPTPSGGQDSDASPTDGADDAADAEQSGDGSQAATA